MNSKQRRTDKRSSFIDWLEVAASKLANALERASHDQCNVAGLEETKAALKFFDDGPDIE